MTIYLLLRFVGSWSFPSVYVFPTSSPITSLRHLSIVEREPRKFQHLRLSKASLSEMDSYYASLTLDATREISSKLTETNAKLDKFLQKLDSDMASSTTRRSEDLKTQSTALQLDHDEIQRLERVRVLVGTQPTPDNLLPDETVKRRGESKGHFKLVQPGKPYQYIHPIHQWVLMTSHPVDLVSFDPVTENAQRDRDLCWGERVKANCEVVSLEALADSWEPRKPEEPEESNDLMLSRAR